MGFLELLKRRILLFHALGIPVRADYRWVFVLILMSVVTASSLASVVNSAGTGLIFGTITTLIFFASIFLHEFAHALAARMEGVQVMEIILHPFGGMARLKHEPETPRAEFRIAVAGPAASFALALVFVTLMAAANAVGADILALLLLTLAVGNFLVAVFNLFPGYPLDGGRVLRAYLWKSGKDLNEATILTGHAGQIIGAVMIVLGLLIAVSRGDFFTGFWTILVGLFLYDAAKGIINEVRGLERVRVDEVMQLPVAVDPDANLLHFIDNILPIHRAGAFPVARDKHFYGILMLEDMKRVPKSEWHTTAVGKVMRPVAPDQFVDLHTPLPEAREIMHANGIGAVGVLDGSGQLVGFIGGRIKRDK